MLVTDLTNVRYLTGFTGTNGACVCGPGVAPLPHRLPLHRARREPRSRAGRRSRSPATGSAAIAERLAGRVGFEDDHMSVRVLRETEGETRRRGRAGRRRRRRSSSCGGSRTRRSWRRSPRPRSSPTRSGAGALERGLAGRSEREVARAAEARIRELGGEPSFPAIVAAGPNGALPHAEPGEREIGRGELVVFDMGAQARRLLLRRHPHLRHRRARARRRRAVYEIVREAQAAALEAISAGVKGEDVDAVARKVIDDAGHGERFGHGLGHGVGLEVHEGPRLSLRSDDVLARRRSRHRRARHLPARRARGADRGPVVVTEDGCRNLSGAARKSCSSSSVRCV